jgi:hypothetical protein
MGTEERNKFDIYFSTNATDATAELTLQNVKHHSKSDNSVM